MIFNQMKSVFCNIKTLFLIGFLIACSPDQPADLVRQESNYNHEASGLITSMLVEGAGKTASHGDTLIVHYTGWIFDENAINNQGHKFDSSLDRDKPFEFRLGVDSLIKGWELGVMNMAVGEIKELIISPELGYGERSLGGIPPHSTLIFNVELVDLIEVD